MKILAYILALCLNLSSVAMAAAAEDATKEAIVKIYTVSKKPNYLEPWNSSTVSSVGSGAIIDGNRILTNAHVIADNTFIEVQRYGKSKRYVASVLSVSHQADLALLEVGDEDFFKGVKPLKLGVLPQVEQNVVVYGFPMGGNTLSATTGVVSRLEHRTYAHSGESFLAIQVDAAVNPGNSGGPALSNGKIVGVVMQSMTDSQNIGYLVPVSMVAHFIEDIKDGKHDGFADVGLLTQKMENPALREYYKIDDDTTGVLVYDIAQNSLLNGIIQKGDILIAINGYKIENDGTVAFRKHEYTSYNYIIDGFQMGQEVTFDLIRNGEKMSLKVPVGTTADDLLLVKTQQYDTMPTYAIFGGYVFSPLSRNLMRFSSFNNLSLSQYLMDFAKKEKQEVVLLLKVLASNHTRGHNEVGFWAIEKINGESFATFEEFFRKLSKIKDGFVVLEDKEGQKVVINATEALQEQETILKRYNIEFPTSANLR
ncbi:MAG TPA: serine protease [Epsilonproteobacteria bacterium]|nr:serine protease [Campylobacterota bacterium]